MPEFTTKDIQALREKTGAGMMDCKKALTESHGDMDKAVELLRKKGAAVAAKRADREAKEGLIAAKVSTDGKKAAMIEVNCETDFVSRNELFGGFVENVINLALSKETKDLEALMAQSGEFSEGRSLNVFAPEMSGKTGEKVEVRRVAFIAAENGVLIDYIHPGSKLGVLVHLDTDAGENEAVQKLGKDIAMQVAAANPMVVVREKMDTTRIEQELDIYRVQAKNEGKPDQIIDRIATGKLEKFYEDTVLTEQKFVKDPSKSVTDVVNEVAKSVGSDIKIVHFERFLLGENL